MRFSAIFALGSAALVTAAPTPIEQDQNLGEFHVSNFKYGSPQEKDWSFDVYVSGHFQGHPGFSDPVYCSGTTDLNSFKESSCDRVSSRESVYAYITDDNKLRLEYSVVQPNRNAHYWFTGNKKVDPTTNGGGWSWGKQPSHFIVKESHARAIA